VVVSAAAAARRSSKVGGGGGVALISGAPARSGAARITAAHGVRMATVFASVLRCSVTAAIPAMLAVISCCMHSSACVLGVIMHIIGGYAYDVVICI
jgi:hypothetical protein